MDDLSITERLIGRSRKRFKERKDAWSGGAIHRLSMDKEGNQRDFF